VGTDPGKEHLSSGDETHMRPATLGHTSDDVVQGQLPEQETDQHPSTPALELALANRNLLTKTTDQRLGTVVADRYEIVSLAGAGGISSVYKAYHRILQKPVAVKFLHQERLSSDTALKRFMQEAKAVSLLNHPNIVSVHDFGATSAGEPYIVMDFLEGASLAEELQTVGPLDLPRFFHIFGQSTEALATAHKQGIVHRDIKPGNIMLVHTGSDPDFVKIVDFGLARLMPQEGEQDQELTRTGEVFGSPLYMSPEQWSGKKLDARSDVYSTGCVMYEALTGAPPHVGSTIYLTMVKHLNDAPAPVRSVRPGLKCIEPLEAVILKALAKEPDQRYQSMSELAEALEEAERFQRSWTERLKAAVAIAQARLRAARLKRSDAALAAGLLCLLLVGLSYWRASLQGMVTVQEAPVVMSVQDLWDKLDREGQARFNAGEYDAAADVLTRALKAARDLGKPEVLELSLKKLALLFHVVGKSQNEQELDAELALLQKEHPSTPTARPEGSDENKVLEKLWSMLPDNPSPEQKQQFIKLSEQINDLAKKYADADNYKAAEPLLQTALRRELNMLGPDHPLVARTLSLLAAVAHDRGDYRRAEELAGRALEIRKQKLPPFDEATARTSHQLAEIYLSQDKYTSAVPLLESEINIYEKDPTSFVAKMAHSYETLAYIADAQQQYEKAIELYKKAQLLFQQAGEHAKAQNCLRELRDLYLQTRQRQEAERVVRDALAYIRKTRGPDDEAVAAYLLVLAELYHSSPPRDMTKALSMYEQALAIQQHRRPPETDSVVRTLQDLMYAYTATGNNRSAEPLARQYLAIRERQYGKDATQTFHPSIRLAHLCMRRGKRQEAKQHFERALPILFAHPQTSLKYVEHAFYELAAAFFTPADYNRMERLLSDSLRQAEAKYGPKAPEVAQRLDDLGHFQLEVGKRVEALELISRAARIVRQNPGMERGDAAMILENQAFVMRLLGKGRAANAVQQEASRIRYNSAASRSE
jgi:tetratricopeptide (TPR) repeat protein/tRNA A-37 threonylcarbamoyl transferase component Bud32